MQPRDICKQGISPSPCFRPLYILLTGQYAAHQTSRRVESAQEQICLSPASHFGIKSPWMDATGDLQVQVPRLPPPGKSLSKKNPADRAVGFLALRILPPHAYQIMSLLPPWCEIPTLRKLFHGPRTCSGWKPGHAAIRTAGHECPHAQFQNGRRIGVLISS